MELDSRPTTNTSRKYVRSEREMESTRDREREGERDRERGGDEEREGRPGRQGGWSWTRGPRPTRHVVARPRLRPPHSADHQIH